MQMLTQGTQAEKQWHPAVLKLRLELPYKGEEMGSFYWTELNFFL